MNGIFPDQAEFFAVNTGFLNGKGMKEFWVCISRELKIQDVRLQEQAKSKIIQDHFEKQREERRVAQEKRKAERDWYSLPRSLNLTHSDRGDGSHVSVKRSDHAHSVPNRGNRNR